MNKNVLIINPPSKDRNVNRDMAGGLGYSAGKGIVLPPLDLLNTAATLRSAGWGVNFIDGVAERVDDIQDYIQRVKKDKCNVLIGNLSLPTLTEDTEFYRLLKRKLKRTKVIVKTGINYSIILEKFTKKSKVDLVVFAECDLNIEEYIDGKELKGTARLVNKMVVITPADGLMVGEMNQLPIPARDLSRIDLYKYVLLPGVSTTMQTSRGCPYPCGYYCPYPLVQGTRWRAMSAPRIVEEMVSVEKLGIESILFRDATFTLDKKRILEMCRLILEKKLRLKWWCETRVNVLDEELLVTMKRAGCLGINVGVETMDSELIESEGKPGVSLKEVIRIRKVAKRIGVKLHFLMIAGLPNDNLKGLYESFLYLLKLRPESMGISAITPYPGTKMFDMAKKEELIVNFDWGNFNGANSNMRTKYLGLKDIWLVRKMIMAGVLFNNVEGIVGKLGVWTVKRAFEMWIWLKKER